jgi:hypothetical protein
MAAPAGYAMRLRISTTLVSVSLLLVERTAAIISERFFFGNMSIRLPMGVWFAF